MVLAGYTYYHFSGLKKLADTGTQAKEYYQQTKQTIQEKAPKSANEALNFLRSTAKSYAGLVPGASGVIDHTFDTLDSLRESHGDEVNKVVNETYDEIQKVVKSSKNGADLETGLKIFAVLKKASGQLQEIGQKAGVHAYGALEDKYPQLASTLGSGYSQLKQLADQAGPEATKVLDETKEQIKKIFSKGLSPEAFSEASELIQSKTGKIQELASQASQKGWDKALEKSSPYLDKLPEIKQLLSDNASKFVAAGAATFQASPVEVTEVFDKVKEVVETKDEKARKKRVEELKEFILAKAKEAEGHASKQLERGWESLQEWIKAVPGGDEALEKLPDVKVFIQLSQERGEDAKKLAKETYHDVFKVLEAKSKKAKELVSKTKEEAKDKSS